MLDRSIFNLIPLRDNSKLPAIKWDDYKTKHYSGPIGKNYAVICGDISKCVVIDLDDKSLATEIFENFEKLKTQTLIVETNKGYHVYIKPKNGEYPHGKMPLTNTRGQHIDVQSNGSYVVGPGSIHPSGKVYTIISTTENIKEIDLDEFLKSLKNYGFNTEHGGLKPFQELIKGRLKEGERNNNAFKYAILLLEDKKLDAETTWFELQNWNKTLQPPLPERELKITFQSALKTHMKKIQPSVKENELKPKRIREITTQDEGEQIIFTAFLAGMDDLKTLTKEAEFQCGKCYMYICRKAESKKVYDSVKTPFCDKCFISMSCKNVIKTEFIRTVVLQELPDEVENNSPVRLIARIHGDVSRMIYISNRKVLINGMFRSVKVKGKDENDIVIEVTNIEYLDDDVDELPSDEELKDFDCEDMKDKIINSFSPHIYGYEDIKESIILYRLGGGNLRRKDIHIMLMGNPSKGKSELLKFLASITNSVYVNGRLASGAGLAAGMVKIPNGSSVPYMGVLALYPFVVIDEFDKMRKEDRAALLECMEQRTVSLKKAGVNLTTRAEACIIAAANPHFGTWNHDMSLSQNINIESFLLSRFDILWAIINSNSMQKAKVARHIIQQAITKSDSIFPLDKLRKYLNYCSLLEPELSLEAGNFIESFYLKTSEFVEDNNKEFLPMDERQLEGIIRMATAHAKLFRKKTVDIEDAKEAIRLFRVALGSFGIKTEEGLTQINLLTPAENREEAFFLSVNTVKNELGYFRHDDVLQQMIKTKFFKDIYKAETFLSAMKEKSKVLLNEDGSYRLSKL